MKKSLFTMVAYKAVLGALLGIIAGLFLGIIIWVLQDLTLLIGKTSYYSGPPFQAFITLGMCFGCLIGSVFGGLTGLKEGKK